VVKRPNKEEWGVGQIAERGTGKAGEEKKNEKEEEAAEQEVAKGKGETCGAIMRAIISCCQFPSHDFQGKNSPGSSAVTADWVLRQVECRPIEVTPKYPLAAIGT
jgi:hypothetical protein